jgi:glutamate dehydrogenase
MLVVRDAAGELGCGTEEQWHALEEILTAVERGEVEDDILNRLALTARLDVGAVDRLRLLVRAGCHLGAAARAAGERALIRHGEAAAALYGVFGARFAPDASAGVADARERFRECVDGMIEGSDREVLRRLGELVDAVVRTDAFRPEGERPSRHDGLARAALAITVDPTRLSWVAAPRLGLETYVQSARTEGLFVRSRGMARGRIVWQDAPDGLRPVLLERLGADRLRHAATVSEAAAGAIALKGFAAASQEARRTAFATLLHSLIDLADNRPGTEHEPRIYARDHDLLGVAGDEDTVALADLANHIAAARGFWLGDAFAPGGSHGYDPVALGIAGRGAWECVRAHLREAGRIIDDAVVVIGAGDMTDPFFGTGMLASPTIRLRAALSPRYLFLDPDPDPSEALAERRRLAENHLGWESYDVSKLSRGGMILARTARRVPVSPEVRALLGLADQHEEVSGEGLARAILGASADVLWTGGAEAAAQALGGAAGPGEARGTALALRAAVVAEGSASGLTPEARVEYARRGGRINSFALDSTADVDLGDHEVVLKLLLKPLVDAGTLGASERDGMLRELRDDVVARVLSRIRARHRALSVDERRCGERPLEHRRAFAWFAERTPDGTALPRDLWESRARPLTRPELSILIARAKLLLKRTLLEDRHLIDDPSSEAFLFHYFPVRVRQQFSGEIRRHPLRREIVASELANTLVDLMGCAFVYRLARDANADVAAVARAWAIAFAAADAREVMHSIAAHEIAEPAGQVALQEAAHGALGGVLEALSRWILGNVPAEQGPSEVVAELARKLREVNSQLPVCFATSDAEAFQRRVTELEMAGLVPMLAKQLAVGFWIPGVLDAVRIGAELGVPWERAARLRSGVGTVLGLGWLEARIGACDAEEDWQHAAARGLREDLAWAWSAIARRLCAAGAVTVAAEAPGMPRERAERVVSLIGDLRAAPALDLTALHVVVREIRKLAES